MKYYYIYKITNKLNNKIYIGQHTTDNLDDGYMGSGTVLHYAFKKYGIENFEKEILRYCKDQDELNYWEAKYVDEEFLNRPDTYNLQTGGNHRILSEESKRKISNSLKGERHPNFGKHHSEETKQKMSKALIGNKRWSGKSHTEEYKQHMREVMKGRRMSDVTKQKLRECNLGKKLSAEVKEKIRQTLSRYRWYNNGIVNKRLNDTDTIPEGFKKGRLRF